MFITSIKKQKSKNFIIPEIYVADIETFLFKGEKQLPFMIGYKKVGSSFKNNYIIKTFPFTNEKIEINEKNCFYLCFQFLLDFIQKISNPKIKNRIFIYFHNLGAFDGIFLLKTIKLFINECQLLKETKVIIRNSRIYEIRIKNIVIRDSFNLLPISLEELSKIYINEAIWKQKFNFTNFDDINFIKTNIFEITNYHKQDLNSLEHIILTFYQFIYSQYQISIRDTMTISSLAFRIFRSQFMREENIFRSNTILEFETFLRCSFFGGFTNVLKPQADNCYNYDVNSLYPTVMCYDLPINEPHMVLLKNDENEIKNFFGFIECEIEVPDNLYYPPLPYKNDNGILINPTGRLKGIWFSEEIKNAINNFNCKIITITKALRFDRGNILNDFVQHFFVLKQNATSENKLFYKLILNSLFGRFALRTDLSETSFVHNNDIYLLSLFYDITFHEDDEKKFYETNETNNQLYFITRKTPIEALTLNQIYQLELSEKKKQKLIDFAILHFSQINKMNIAVQISSAITAYARIFMVNIINQEISINKNIIYYTDTDSIISKNPIDQNLCDDKVLGKFKLVNTPEKAIFIAPKVYALQINNEWKATFKGLDTIEKENLQNDPIKLQSLSENNPLKIETIDNFKKSFNSLEILKIKKSLIFTLLSQKREKIFDLNNTWIDTKPIKIQ